MACFFVFALCPSSGSVLKFGNACRGIFWLKFGNACRGIFWLKFGNACRGIFWLKLLGMLVEGYFG